MGKPNEVEFTVKYVEADPMSYVELSSQVGTRDILCSPLVAWLNWSWVALVAGSIVGAFFVHTGAFVAALLTLGVAGGMACGITYDETRMVPICPLGNLFLNRRINRAKRKLLKEYIDYENQSAVKNKKCKEMADLVQSYSETVKVDWENRRAF